jgi:spore germination protein KA
MDYTPALHNKGEVIHFKLRGCTMSRAKEEPLAEELQSNLEWIKEAFTYPTNNALKFRQVYIPFIDTLGTVLYIDGAVDLQTLQQHIIEPLVLKQSDGAERGEDPITRIQQQVLTSSTGRSVSKRKDLIHDLLIGNAIVLLEGQGQALSIEAPGFERRSIGEPKVEHVLKGSKEAFTESIATNLSLVRKQLKDSHLISEMIPLGSRVDSTVWLLYNKQLTNPGLVNNVKKRIQDIQSDYVPNLSIVEQFIEERPYSIIPTTLTTERPDRACAFLEEGHIVLLMDNSPFALIAPITFWALFHTSEDMNMRWMYGNFMRLVRIFAIFIALLTPSIYIAVSTFHEEMLQTDLLLAIAATRERVPFPAFVEVIFMELAFELVREAGVRIPSVIGPTVGIVGALILGQAAVEANIISPILVIIVAITGLASFAIPEISFNFAVRIFRFLLLVTASFMGFYGIALILTCLVSYLVSLKSFEVPFLAPLAPHYRSSKDMIVRPPVWKQWLRPFYNKPLTKTRMKKPEGNNDV